MLTEEYVGCVDWEPRQTLEERVAALLPALLLARVDGKSPAEYLDDDRYRSLVRTVAAVLLRAPAPTVADVLDTWAAALDVPTGPGTGRRD